MLKVALWIFLIQTLPFAALASEIPKLSDLTAIPLQEGVNTVPHFASDDRDATITKAWRDNGNAHSYWVYTVMLQGIQPPHQWELVGVDAKPKFQDTIIETPHTYEDYVRSVRFLHGKVSGQSATLLAIAERDLSHTASMPSPTPVRINVYQLSENAFHPIIARVTDKCYSNSELAISQTLNLPLPENYAGPHDAEPCPARN